VRVGVCVGPSKLLAVCEREWPGGHLVINKIGRNFVMVRCGQYFILSIYIAPSESNLEFHKTLDELGTAICAAGSKCVVTDDFNAKSVLWRSPGFDWHGRVGPEAY